jgi:hypothetical protein
MLAASCLSSPLPDTTPDRSMGSYVVLQALDDLDAIVAEVQLP